MLRYASKSNLEVLKNKDYLFMTEKKASKLYHQVPKNKDWFFMTKNNNRGGSRIFQTGGVWRH